MGVASVGFRFLLATAFLLAGVSKLTYRPRFESIVNDYNLLPHGLVAPVARLVPLLEVVSAIALFLGLASPLVLVALGVMLAAFAIGVAANLVRGRVIECGCAGSRGQLISWPLALQDAFFSAAALFSAFHLPPVLSLWSPPLAGTSSELSTSQSAALLITASLGYLSVRLFMEAGGLFRTYPARGKA